eukprot:g5059.t1
MLSLLLLLFGVLKSNAIAPLTNSRSLSTLFQDSDCVLRFDGKNMSDRVTNGTGKYYCFQHRVSCIRYKVDVETRTDNGELAKLLVLVKEREDLDDFQGKSFENYKEDSICTESRCDKDVDVDDRKEYEVLVINDNFTEPKFNEASGVNVTYTIKIDGCPTKYHIWAVILIVFAVIFAVLGIISCFLVRSRRQNKLAALRQEGGLNPNQSLQTTQMTGVTNKNHNNVMSPIGSSQQPQSAVPWAVPVDSPTLTAPLPPRF